MNRLRTKSDRLNSQMVRYNKVSPGLLSLIEHQHQHTISREGNLAVAMGTLVKYNETGVSKFMLIKALPWLAQMLGKIRASNTQEPYLPIIEGFSSFVSTWTILDKDKSVDVDNARAVILSELRNNPLDKADWIEILGLILERAERESHSQKWYSVEELISFFRLEHADQAWEPPVHNQKFVLMQFSGHWFPTDAIKPDYQGLITDLVRLDGNAVAIAEKDASKYLIDDVQTIWGNLIDEERLALIEMLAEVHKEEANKWGAAGAILMVGGLCKASAVTENWLTTRCERLEYDTGIKDLRNLINIDMFKKFMIHNSRDTLKTDDIYRILIGSYNLISESNLQSLQWIIEQGAAHNIAPGLAFAKVITQIKGSHIDYLRKVVPEYEFNNLALLAGHILYDRYCSIIKPPIIAASYADLAYIGAYLEFFSKTTTRNASSYAGNPDINATLSKTQLTQLALSIRREGEEFITSLTDRVEYIRSLFPNLQVEEEGSDYYFSSNDRTYKGIKKTDVQPSPGHPVQQNQNASDVEEDYWLQFPNPGSLPPEQADDLQRTSRSGWSRRMRNLPPNTVRISSATLIQKLAQVESDYSKSFKIIMSALHQASTQTALPIFGESKISGPQWKKKLDDTILEAYRTMQIQIPDPWTKVPEDLPEIKGIDNEDTNMVMLYRYAKPSDQGSTPPTVPNNPSPQVPQTTTLPVVQISQPPQQPPPSFSIPSGTSVELYPIVEEYKDQLPTLTENELSHINSLPHVTSVKSFVAAVPVYTMLSSRQWIRILHSTFKLPVDNGLLIWSPTTSPCYKAFTLLMNLYPVVFVIIDRTTKQKVHLKKEDTSKRIQALKDLGFSIPTSMTPIKDYNDEWVRNTWRDIVFPEGNAWKISDIYRLYPLFVSKAESQLVKEIIAQFRTDYRIPDDVEEWTILYLLYFGSSDVKKACEYLRDVSDTKSGTSLEELDKLIKEKSADELESGI